MSNKSTQEHTEAEQIATNKSNALLSAQMRPSDRITAQSKVTDLPFVEDIEGKRVFWSVRPTGDYGYDCLVGKAYCLEWLQYSECTNDASQITWVISAMPKKLTGVESGFLHELQANARNGFVQQSTNG